MQTLLLVTIFSCGLSSSPRASSAPSTRTASVASIAAALLLIAAFHVAGLAESARVTLAALAGIGTRLDAVHEAEVAVVHVADGLVAAVVAVLTGARLVTAL